ncbi:MAG: hemerythrin domain-containing protein [Proteobacteria bacterium]|nr:hemerythrin domain-containing protein [Burkholderiales bacterium]
MAPSALSEAMTDPFESLEQDHQDVDELFDQFAQMEDDEEGEVDAAKIEIVEMICQKLNLHAQLEEEIVYPELQAVIDQPELIDEAEAEHAAAKELIAQLETMDPSDPEFDSTVELLAQSIRAHVAKEESEIFPMGRESSMDFSRVSASLDARRIELDPEMDDSDDDDEEESSSRSGRAPSGAMGRLAG